MKKVLVTGASGFIGRNTLDLLQKKGYQVHAVNPKKIQWDNKEIYWHIADLTNLAEVDNLLKKVSPTHLIHLAWDVTPGQYKNSPNNLIWVQSGLQLIRSFNKYGGKRAVFAGTCFEYDLNYGCLDEKLTPINPSSLYSNCKASLKNIVESYCDQCHISFAWGRVFYVYGPYENPNRIIPYVIQSLLKGKVAHVSHGNQIRDFLNVYDVGSAFVNILDSNVEGSVNIASGNPIKLKDIFIRIGEKLGKKNLVSLGDIKALENEPKIIVANNNRIINEVNWSPFYDIDTGLDETIKWWMDIKN